MSPVKRPIKRSPAPTRPAPAKKPARVTPAASAPAPAQVAPEKKRKKDKVVRDSFTMPKADYERIAALKQACLAAGVAVKKSELLRAGLIALQDLPAAQLVRALSKLESIKTGRPAAEQPAPQTQSKPKKSTGKRQV